MNYHVGRAGQQLGVFSLDQIRAMVARGELRADDLGWREGMANWQPLGEIIPDLGMATPPPPPPSAGGFARPPGAPPVFGFGGTPPKPGNNLVPAILVTLFCCLPFGVASIVYASQVDSKYAIGDYVGAAESAAKSKKWMWWSIGCGLVFSIIYGALVVTGAVSSAASGFEP